MSVVINQAFQSLSSGEFEFTDPDRYEEIDHKQTQVAEFLQARGYDAVLLQSAASFAWFTAGCELPRCVNGDPAAALFITPDARVVVANNIDAPQLFDKQLGGLGFQLKQRPWYEDRQILLDDLTRGRKVASDSGRSGTVNEAALLAELRLPLSPVECERMRELGTMVTHAVEATARHVEAGQSESEIAGQVSHRLIHHQIQPLRVRTMVDGRGAAYRHWTYSDLQLNRWCVVSAIGSRWGLCCAASRTVVLGSPPSEVVAAFQQAAMLEATGMCFSLPGLSLESAWQKVRRIYEKQGIAEEWQHADQADVIGFSPSEVMLTPESRFVMRPHTAIHWHPSVGPVHVGDTLLVGESGAEIITRPADWPLLHITVKGQPWLLPDLLVRETPASP